jgi:hypothetical protein
MKSIKMLRMKSKMPSSVKRSLPYIKVLVRSKKNINKIDLLRDFPSFVINDITEILFNIITGKLKVTDKDVKHLKKYKKPLLHLVNTPKKSRKSFIYKQKGGFIGAVLPIIASLIGGLVSNVV